MIRLSDTAMDAFRASYRSFEKKDLAMIEPTHQLIDKANDICQAMVNYLIRLSAQSKLADEKTISDLHSNLGDITRISEIADNLTKYTQKTVENGLIFSGSVMDELSEMVEQVEHLYTLVRRAILEKELGLLPQIERTENCIDDLRKKLIDSHIQRLNQGECRAESSGIFINLVSNLERLGDHLTYIAYTIQEYH